MMLPTHVFIGAVIASVTLYTAPEYVVVALLGGVAGSILPDLDIVFSHRKTFHFPFYYSVAAFIGLLLAVFLPSRLTMFVAFFLIGAAVHSVSDMFGAGLGLRPWANDDQRGVYNHRSGDWVPPRRWIPYDGAPHDFGLSLLLGMVLVTLYEGVIEVAVVIVLAISLVYVLIRKKLVEWAPARFR